MLNVNFEAMELQDKIKKILQEYYPYCDDEDLSKELLYLHSVSHSYYQVVYNGYDDDIEEVTSPLPTLERAKKALEANKAYFDEEMYIIAKINCG